ncbi:hypothetical protein ACHAW6_011766 [Cyclotella cf. meneghiniana]
MSQPPLDPPPFDQPMIRRCIRTDVRIQNHEYMQEVLILTTVLCSVESQLNPNPNKEDNSEEENWDGTSSNHEDLSDFSDMSSDEEESDNDTDSGSSIINRNAHHGDAPQCRDSNEERYKMKAFWMKREPICENHHGIYATRIFYAKVLNKADLYWIATDEEVAIKRVSWEDIRKSQNRLSEDFVKEISALQYLSQWRATEMPGMSIIDTHVMTADTVMCDECYLYIVMPFCRGGDLCQMVAESGRFPEDQSRFWFRQILQVGLETLQRARICHRDLSPENFIIIDDRSLVIDFGMCLRIPYVNEERRLISARNPCGKLPHMAPEIYTRLPFDGHAIDMWAAGTVLLFMLTGKRLSYPPLIDRAFEGVELGLSYEATDLLRKMFRLNPNDRLTLRQIQQHTFLT